MLTLFNSVGEISSSVAVFLQAIRANPTEDLHRLALADFLEELPNATAQDRAHAELIRLQCQQAHTQRYSPDWFRLSYATSDLICGSGLTRVPTDDRAVYDRFERGFPAAIRVYAPSQLARTPVAFDLGTIDEIAVDVVRSTDALIRVPWLERITAITLGCDPAEERLGSGKWAATLSTIQPGGLTALIASGKVCQVKRWSLWRRQFANELIALRDEVRSGRMVVDELNLGCPLDTADVSSLVEIGRRMIQGSLCFSRMDVAGPALLGLIASPPDQGRSLRELSLDYTPWAVPDGDEHMRRLAGWPGARQLEYLSVIAGTRGNRITDRGLESLAESEYLSGLGALRLDGNRITDRGAAALINTPTTWNLRWLGLSNTRVTADAAARLQDRFPNCYVEYGSG